MKKLPLTINGLLLTILLFAAKPAVLLAQTDNGNGTSGYPMTGMMGLVVIVILLVAGIGWFAWRQKK